MKTCCFLAVKACLQNGHTFKIFAGGLAGGTKKLAKGLFNTVLKVLESRHFIKQAGCMEDHSPNQAHA